MYIALRIPSESCMDMRHTVMGLTSKCKTVYYIHALKSKAQHDTSPSESNTNDTGY